MIVLPKILDDLSLYAVSASDLTTVQSFLKDVTRGATHQLVLTSLSSWKIVTTTFLTNLHVVTIRYIVCFLGTKIHRCALEIDPA